MPQFSNPAIVVQKLRMGGIWDRWLRFAMRHERAIAIVSAIWFALGCAVTARFVVLPEWLEVPYLTDRNAFWLTGAWNAAFWGYIHPKLEAKRKALAVQDVRPLPEA
ncbi:hypothetical protein [Parerythrobacter lacustris]|uniref:DUF4212 domain-containing protein n=1 Tax=Parerythrobacter lacustris TaxID=2969984 RepID=A0ABT1XNR7_9SPHN|nr:hypothetical protein [Parerythrobacter lacustris]MCR2832576.1 hypothetical protein [Parerythrobacter lacustris]